MTKSKAFLLHLIISATAFAAFLWVLIRFWYPMPYFVADGGWQGLRLVMGIDAILGPVCTLVVYKSWKTRRALTFDYAVIGLLQAAALTFGVWTTFSQRTGMVTFADGSFYTLDPQTAERIGPTARSLVDACRGRPAYTYVHLPSDFFERQELRKISLSRRRPLYMFDELLRRFDASGLQLAEEYAVELTGQGAGPGASTAMRRFLKTSGGQANEYVFLSAVGRYRNFVLAFRRTDEPPATRGNNRREGALTPAGYLWIDGAKLNRERKIRLPRAAKSGNAPPTDAS